MAIADYFALTYGAARQKFLAAAARAGATLTSYRLPDRNGPEGEELCTDVAVLGSARPRCALVVLSATHGAEGFCGSGCQVGLLEDRFDQWLPPDGALVLVHALNPYGFAWKRRVNEDGIDLNRNFVDFDAPLPDSTPYEELHEFLIPAAWEGSARRQADEALHAFVARHGVRAFQAAVTAGQYTRPSGLFYGGTRRAWSARTLESILTTLLPTEMRSCVVLDLHTGLGPRGYGELIAFGSREDCDRARALFGPEVRTIDAGESVSAPVAGTVNLGVRHALGVCPLTYVALEYGTVPFDDVLTALRADHWAWTHAPGAGPALATAQQSMLAAFFGDEPAWKAAVYGRTADMAARALRELR